MSDPTWHPKTGTQFVTDTICPCTFGACGHCTNGEHEKCVEVADPAEAARMAAQKPVAFLMNRAGMVPIFKNGVVAKFYLDRAGAHTWRCPCHLDGHADALAQTSLDLFGEVTA